LDASRNKFVRVPDGDALSLAVEKLNLDAEDREWLISAPGKVILFGEHAVVHGVVSFSFFFIQGQERAASGNEPGSTIPVFIRFFFSS